MSTAAGSFEPIADIGSWRDHPQNRWSFQNIRQIIPTSPLNAAGNNAGRDNWNTVELPELFAASDTEWSDTTNFSDLLLRAHCDGILVLHRGIPAGRWIAPWFSAESPHILFSVSKSLTGLLTGILVGNGVLDPTLPVGHYIAGLRDCVYGQCALRHLLDMTVALDFEEEYVDPQSEYVRYRIATGWNPVNQRNPGPGLEEFLKTMQATGENHGERFLYRSPNSDMLGLVIEETAGIPFAQAFSELLWQPMGAHTDGYVTLDHHGLARAAGGICVTLADLARVGQLMLHRGAACGCQVVAESWVEDTWSAGSRDAWLRGNYSHKLPHGRYRNQWYQSGDEDRCLHARGIHGQLLYINPAREVVIARVSSQPDPLDDAITAEVLAACGQIARSLGERA